jgi:hypothetical protein
MNATIEAAMSLKLVRVIRSALLAILTAGLVACSGDSDTQDPTPSNYPAPTSPANVLEALRLAWERQDVGAIDALLAEDFVFHLAPGAARDLGFTTWGRRGELEACALIFDAPTVRDIYVEFATTPEHSVNEVGRESERRIDAFQTDISLEDRVSLDPESNVYVAHDNINHFYFRQGRTPDDVSDTRWYLTQWNDLGRPTGAPGRHRLAVLADPRHPLPIQEVNWTELKLLHGTPVHRD